MALDLNMHLVFVFSGMTRISCNLPFKVKHRFIIRSESVNSTITINLCGFTLSTLLYNTFNECVQQNYLFFLLPIGENMVSCFIVVNDKKELKIGFILE